MLTPLDSPGGCWGGEADVEIMGVVDKCFTSVAINHRIPLLLFSVAISATLLLKASGGLFANATAILCVSTFPSWPPCQTYSCDSRNALPPSYPTVRHIPLRAPQKMAIARADGEMVRTWRPVPVAVRSTLAEDAFRQMQVLLPTFTFPAARCGLSI
ncbi:hypothetical protein DFH11DRAFT_1640991 [Phellopilus nigrolimitatus]|nr:hypothetical protein DFH11DRAFT_1640991 [Phellopilus nigrolimitatus]